MEQFASALEELGVLEVADLAEVTGAQLDAMGMTVIHCASGCDGKCPPLKMVRRRVRKGSRGRLPPRARVRKVSRGRRLPIAAGPSELVFPRGASANCETVTGHQHLMNVPALHVIEQHE